MALTRREWLLALPLVATASIACSGPSHRAAAAAAYVELFSSGPAGAERTILVFMPETSQTKEVWTGLNDELGQDYRLVAVRVDGPDAASVISRAVTRHRPSGIVLMNNPTVRAYRDYQRLSGANRFPPAVVVMTSFLERQARHLEAATGISYEVPLITVVTNLRKLMANPIERIAVVHRSPLRQFVINQAGLARREQIGVIREEVSAEPNVSELKGALRRAKRYADAVWILNDDRLLTPDLIVDGWIPALNERPWSPTIVGAASLVSAGQSFGTFAVLPDHTALGVQAASLMFDIADNGWNVDEGEPQLPLSTTVTVDLVQARERFVLRADALKQVDRILE